jgi:hypothetical protein
MVSLGLWIIFAIIFSGKSLILYAILVSKKAYDSIYSYEHNIDFDRSQLHWSFYISRILRMIDLFLIFPIMSIFKYIYIKTYQRDFDDSLIVELILNSSLIYHVIEYTDSEFIFRMNYIGLNSEGCYYEIKFVKTKYDVFESYWKIHRVMLNEVDQQKFDIMTFIKLFVCVHHNDVHYRALKVRKYLGYEKIMELKKIVGWFFLENVSPYHEFESSASMGFDIDDLTLLRMNSNHETIKQNVILLQKINNDFSLFCRSGFIIFQNKFKKLIDNKIIFDLWISWVCHSIDHQTGYNVLYNLRSLSERELMFSIKDIGTISQMQLTSLTTFTNDLKLRLQRVNLRYSNMLYVVDLV